MGAPRPVRPQGVTLTVDPDTGRLVAGCHGVFAVARCIATGHDTWRTITPAELDQLAHTPTLHVVCPLCGRSCLQ